MKPFEFERNIYTGKEIIERIEFYADKAKEGKNIAKSNQKKAMTILRELKEDLAQETSYYEKGRFEKNMLALNSNVLNSYCWTIKKAFWSLTDTNKLSKLTWNLDEIRSEMIFFDTNIIDENEFYGNKYYQKINKKLKEDNISFSEEQFLRSVQDFYGRPSQKTAKSVKDNSKGLSDDYIKEYLNLILYKNIEKK